MIVYNHNDMTPNARYVVTHPSNDGTFQFNDHIWKANDGSIMCQEAQGWIPEDEVDAASKGFQLQLDQDYITKRKQQLQQQLDSLDGTI